MVRRPVVAGRFYPGTPVELTEAIDDCYRSSLGVGSRRLPVNGRLAGAILPHAGYVFSGPVASWGFQRLGAEKPLPRRLLLLGPKHTHLGAQAAISAASAWKTPLGEVRVDAGLRDLLLDTGVFSRDDQAHAEEHSLEVQLPFLQHLYGDEDFSITPLALEYSSFEDCARWGKALAGVLEAPGQRDVCVLVSSDFSHETPRAEAYARDGEAIELIVQRRAQAFHELVMQERRSICGFIPITVLLCALEKRAMQVSRLTYATSMDVMPHPRGVGYAAITFEEAA
jgi:hypothetical protein